MRKPAYSIIIPTLNEEKFLPKLLDSLTRQTDKRFEVIVVDGPSIDQTKKVARSYKKKLMITVLSSTQGNLPLQRNMGAEVAKGEWYAFIDADSILMPYFIERITRFITEQSPQLFTTWCQPDAADPKEAMYTLIGMLYMEAMILLKKPLTPGPLTIVHRNAFRLVDGYDEAHQYNEDADFGLRLHTSGVRLMMLREVLYILCLRRIRNEGTLKVLNQYVLSILPILLFNRSLKRMPGYIMGGHLYGKRKVKQTMLNIYERKLKALMKELFS